MRGGLVKPDAPARPALPRGDLTKEEQTHVRATLRFARIRASGWKALALAMRYSHRGLENALYGGVVTASVAVRLARFAGCPWMMFCRGGGRQGARVHTADSVQIRPPRFDSSA